MSAKSLGFFWQETCKNSISLLDVESECILIERALKDLFSQLYPGSKACQVSYALCSSMSLLLSFNIKDSQIVKPWMSGPSMTCLVKHSDHFKTTA